MFPPAYNTSGVVGHLNLKPGDAGGLIVMASGRKISKPRNWMENPLMKNTSSLAASTGQEGYRGRLGPGHRE